MNEQMTRHILRAPLSFFHINPSGRILNRFSKDQGVVDDFLPQVLFDAIQSIFMVLGGAPCLSQTSISHIWCGKWHFATGFATTASRASSWSWVGSLACHRHGHASDVHVHHLSHAM